jgi:hypothetical protein
VKTAIAKEPAPAPGLQSFEKAKAALAACRRVDEAKDIHDKAAGMAVYAKMANDHSLEADAVEIRMRATRRINELIKAQAASVGLNRGTLRRGLENNPRDDRPTLDSQGIDKNLATEARKLGSMSANEFEDAVRKKRDGIAKRKLAPASRNPKSSGGKAKPRVSTSNVRTAVLAMLKTFGKDRELVGIVFEELRRMLDELQKETLARLGE